MLTSGTPLNRSDMSATGLLVMAVVIVATLALWLVLVFLAARAPRRRGLQPGEQAPTEPATLTGPPAQQARAAGPSALEVLPEPARQAAGNGHATESTPALFP